MTENELHALIAKDMHAQALATKAGPLLTGQTIREAITATDPLTKFKELLLERTKGGT